MVVPRSQLFALTQAQLEQKPPTEIFYVSKHILLKSCIPKTCSKLLGDFLQLGIYPPSLRRKQKCHKIYVHLLLYSVTTCYILQMCLLLHLNLLPLLQIFCSITLKGPMYPGNTHFNHMLLHLQQQAHMWLQTEKLVSISLHALHNIQSLSLQHGLGQS